MKALLNLVPSFASPRLSRDAEFPLGKGEIVQTGSHWECALKNTLHPFRLRMPNGCGLSAASLALIERSARSPVLCRIEGHGRGRQVCSQPPMLPHGLVLALTGPPDGAQPCPVRQIRLVIFHCHLRLISAVIVL